MRHLWTGDTVDHRGEYYEVESVRKYVDAGYDRLYFHQIGPDQDGFFRFWESELEAAVTGRG